MQLEIYNENQHLTSSLFVRASTIKKRPHQHQQQDDDKLFLSKAISCEKRADIIVA